MQLFIGHVLTPGLNRLSLTAGKTSSCHSSRWPVLNFNKCLFVYLQYLRIEFGTKNVLKSAQRKKKKIVDIKLDL